MKKPKLLKRMLSLSVELDKWIKKQGKMKPFRTSSAYVRAVLKADYDKYQSKFQNSKSKR
jgi:Arc/MetJ-type ribon-helix-helix transcriptional regulator